MPDHDYVPLMFQAQVGGRSQIQRLVPKAPRQQAYDWAKQWQEACDVQTVPAFDAHVQTHPCKFTWRMVTNSGQDAGVIRPVIGERGWAFFPGSSMKGAFLRACQQLCPPDEVRHYCGGKGKDGDLHPGILRFHGGYPKDGQWLDNSLVDIAHPQEEWQTKDQTDHSAFIQISLYQPTFVFGISSTKELPDSEWAEIWKIWDKALERGIGSRVSAGYGQVKNHGESRLVPVGLFGQGAASRRIDREGEFRPNVFKAALRGHTRRLFLGITDQQTSDRLTKQLWGGIGIGKGESATVGLLGIAFNAPDLELDEWVAAGNRNNRVPIYETGDAMLDVLVMQDHLPQAQRDELKSFVIRLVKFSMLLGGFGKSWRRADHGLFMRDYKRQMIGCHWEFTKPSRKLHIPTKDNLLGITRFLETFHQKAHEFSWLTAISDRKAPDKIWREAWNKENVQVWGRIADAEDDSLAIAWFHDDYRKGHKIKQSELTGSMNQIGRIWHRMYPRYLPPTAEKAPPRETEQFVELLTIFPNRSGKEDEVQKTADFLQFLDESTDFKHLW